MTDVDSKRDKPADHLIGEPEPIFTLRAQDALSVVTIQSYIDWCVRFGLYDQAGTAGRSLATFRAWQNDNIKRTHLPLYGGKLKETM